jgi:hypothetical protein
MGSRNTNNSRCFFFTKHKIRDSAKSTLCEYVAVVDNSIQNFLVQHIHLKQITRFCGKKQSFKMFTDIIPTMYKNENFEYSKSTLLHVLCTVGGGVANNLNDASHLPHSAESFLILFCTSCELTEGSQRRNYTFTSSIRGAPSRPGIVRTRKRSES